MSHADAVLDNYSAEVQKIFAILATIAQLREMSSFYLAYYLSTHTLKGVFEVSD